MIDLKRTLSLISGGMFDSEQTWRNYLPEAENWQKTAFLLTGPLIIFAAVAAYIFGFLGSDISLFGQFRPTIISTILTMITSAIAAVVVAFVVSALAGAFGGKNNFALGLAATTFAFIPGYLGQAVTWLPWVGGLLAFGLFIYALVLLWKVIPVYLAVPDEKRVGHYILSLVVTVAAMLILSMTLGRFLHPSVNGPSFDRAPDVSSPDSSSGAAMYSGFARQAELMATAEEDRFDPPSDGRLSKNQVREFIRVMQRTQELQQQKTARLKALAEKADRDEEVSLGDLGSMMSGMTEAAGLQTSEIEVVKSAGGNWAEHQWVRESLRTAWVQKDINDAVAHNFKLYQEFEEELSDYIVR
ncbi:MAG: YIP1 family protein [Gammaproteobacteria bacterium]|nr:YIP1 family protein [Gammaproteobacteria bacterium]